MKKYYILIILACLVLNVEAKKPIEKQKNKPLNEKINLKPASWFSDIVESISSIWQPVWGKYSEGGSTNRSYPLACADRKTEIADLRQILIESIRYGQYFDSTTWRIYNEIFKNASNPIVSCGDNGTCVSASRIKDAAFVYWLGVNDTGGTLLSGARQIYLDKVKSGMWSWADSKAGSFSGKGNQVYRAKENIMLMQAYNFLEMAKQENAALLPDNVREDLREEIFKFTFELYSRANNFLSGSTLSLGIEGGALTDRTSNNMTLIVASAVGMGAIIISERETYWWANQRKPDRWANAAHAYMESTMFEGSGSLADASIGDGGSFSEGPFYYKFSFEAMLPFFQSFKNFTNGKENNFGPYYKCTLCWGQYKLLTNYYNNSNYLGLADWYNNIKMPNGDAPSIDDSWSTSNNFGGLALTGDPRHSIVPDPTGILTSPHMNLMADYLARYNYYEDGNNTIQDSYKSYNGDIVVRSNKDSSLQSQHYIHLNVESNKAINGGEPTIIYLEPFHKPITFGHEHADIGNIIIAAGEDVLAIDPAYYGDQDLDNHNVNKGRHHNVITIDGAGPDWDDETEWADLIKTYNGYKMSYKGNYWNYNLGIRISKKAIVTRDIRVCRVNDTLPPYYEIDDYVTNRNWWDNEAVRFNLNGNGNQNEGSFRLLDNNTGVWDYPCKKDNDSSDNWKMQATVTTLIDGDIIEKDAIVVNGYKHGNFNTIFNPQLNGTIFKTTEDRNITKNIGSGNSRGEHTRLVKELTIEPDVKAHFHTTIRVFKCTDKDTLIPQIQKSGKYTSHLLLFDKSDSLRNFHMSRIDKTIDVDSISNPFNIPNTKLKTNAQNVFFSYSLNKNSLFGCCVAKSNFRAASIENGNNLIYNDTSYIKSNKTCEAYYKLVGKYKYQGYIQCDSIDSVSFYLPDMDSNYAMGALGKGLTYVYNDTSHIITLIVPAGYTDFLIQMVDPCIMNCYFPTATDSIKNTFNYNTSVPEALPYKLTITTPNGLLKINNASHLTICPQKWLRNNDSLIMEGPYPKTETRPGAIICPDLSAGGIGPNIAMLDYNDKSQITISPQAALILDSGSYTRFGNNTRINVLANGSLIIRKNAKLHIGDEKGCGHAEIICHPNSYVHFEDSADIMFWKKPGDTSDIHLFYISLKPSITAAHAGIAPSMATMLSTVDSIPVGTAAAICNVAQIRASYGVNNRDWGFANFVKPKAWAYISQDTFCPGQCPTISFDRMLNDVKRSIKFCRIDTNYAVNPPEAIFTNCIYPDIKGGNTTNTSAGSDLCDTLQYIEPITICNTQTDDPGKWYRISLIATNDCDQQDSINLYYYNQHNLNPEFAITKNVCNNNIKAFEISDTISKKYRTYTRWHVHLVDTNLVNSNTQNKQYGGDWEYQNLSYPDTFTFPNFKWIGGFKYAVAHTIGTYACADTTVWDSIIVIPGAYISLSKPTVYGQSLSGATSVQLNGNLSHADSFTWQPNTWLNRTDTLHIITTPTDSITYTLTAYKNGCTASDTVHIKYNRFANAGYSDTLCLDSTHSTEKLIGFPYDMSLFLGMLYYYDNTQFMSYYNSHNTGNSPNYFRYFTHFMHTDNFKNSATSCPVDLYNLFTNTLQKHLFFNKSWYRGYYMQFTQFNNSSLPALATFYNQVFNATVLKDHLDSLNNWGNIDPCINDILNQYDDYVQNHVTEISTTWSKIVNNDTTNLSSWNNFFVAENAPIKSTKYILNVITPSAAEIDEITMLVDTILTPLFAPGFQFDSTVYLVNFTEPVSNATSYEWNFGDGSANSFELNALHTFPAFDSNYVVCLTASNKCSSFMYCDTVWVDSLHLGGNLKTAPKPAFFETNSNNDKKPSSMVYRPLTNSQLSTDNIQLSNYPNPFNSSTIIDYQIWQSFNQAELRITNVLGQTVFTQKLNKPIDKINIDGSLLANGIYYYTLIIDGNSIKTKSMSVVK